MPSVHTAQDTTAVLDLTPRQDRIERAIVVALRTNAPRSRVREAVCDLVDYLRLLGHPAAHVREHVLALVRRNAWPDDVRDESAGLSSAERVSLASSWIAERTARAD